MGIVLYFTRETVRRCCGIVFPRFFLALLLCALAQPALADSAADELHAAQLLESLAILRYQASTRTPADRAALEKVTQVYENLAQKYPHDAAVREAFGSFFWQIEQRAKAVKQWEIGEKLDPQNADLVFHLGAAALLEAGQAKRATEYFVRATQLAPHEALFHFQLGNALYLFRHELIDEKTPDTDAVAQRALEEFRVAADLDPFHTEYLKNYAEAFYTLRAPDWSAALRAWQRYREVSGNLDLAYSHLARVSLKMGRKAEARDFLNHITSPNFQRMKERLGRQIEGNAAPPEGS